MVIRLLIILYVYHCVFVISAAENKRTKLTHAMFFNKKICYGENHSLNYKFARGIDIRIHVNKTDEYL